MIPAKETCSLPVFLGAIILLVWWLEPQWLRITQPNFTGCNPLTACCFILFGLALSARFAHPEKKQLPLLLSLVILSISLFRITSGWRGIVFPLDKLLFRARLYGVQFSMATATCFALFSLAVMLKVLAPRTADRWGLFLLLPAAYIALFSLLGFMLNEKDVRESFFLSPMSLLTTVQFLILLYPILTLFRANPLLMVFQSPLLGGLVARRLLPYFLLVPIMVFVFGVVGRRTGVFSYALSGSAQISVLFFVLLLVLVKLAGVIDSLDEQQKNSNELLRANAAVLDKANKDLQTFTYAASHDLQEPLRKISIYAGMIRDRPDHPGINGYLEKIIRSAQRGTQLIHDILQYSRTSYHQESFVSTDLGEILAEVMTDFDRSDQALSPQIALGPMPVLVATPFQMRQLFSNLMSNALKFAARDRRPVISISASVLPPGENLFPGYIPTRKYWKIMFSDNGEGFEEKNAARIFEVFQRVSRNKIAGSGIGLSLCKKIVDTHGGKISASSSPGAGASFTIILPENQG